MLLPEAIATAGSRASIIKVLTAVGRSNSGVSWLNWVPV